MIKNISESDIRNASNLERCQMLIKIINGEAVYTKE